MEVIDKLGLEHNLDGAKMVYLSLMVAGQLLSRNLFLVAGPEARATLKSQMEDTISEIMESAIENMNRTEREMMGMSQGGVILPH